jgi:hypothetical protein
MKTYIFLGYEVSKRPVINDHANYQYDRAKGSLNVLF